jgi:uncharacterized protein
VTRLFGRGETFFGILADAATTAVDAAVVLREACDRYPERIVGLDVVHALEQRGDVHVARMREALDGTFGTPIASRDLHRLAVGLDAVTDCIDEVAVELLLFRPRSLPEGARAQARVLMLACQRLSDAAGRLPAFTLIAGDLEDVRRLEEEGDRLRRDATAALFHSGLDALEIIRLKNVHESLERAIDACRSVADELAMVALRERA